MTTGSFVAVNAGRDTSIERFRVLLDAPGATARSKSWGWETLADTHRDRRSWDLAAACYDSALVWQPGSARLLANRAGTLSWSGRHRESADDYARAAIAEPETPGIWFNFGLELERVGSSDSAMAAFGEALRRRPDDAECLNHRAKLLLEAGRMMEALPLIHRSLELDPGQRLAGQLRRMLTRHGSPADSTPPALPFTPPRARPAGPVRPARTDTPDDAGPLQDMW